MAKRAFNLPNMLTYARIVAVPLVVLCFFLEGRLKSSDFARWSALLIFVAASITDDHDATEVAKGTVARYTVEKGQPHRMETLAGPGAARLFDGFEETKNGCNK
jgi:hypothetical protein